MAVSRQNNMTRTEEAQAVVARPRTQPVQGLKGLLVQHVERQQAALGVDAMLQDMQRVGYKLLQRLEQVSDAKEVGQVLGEKDGVISLYVKLVGSLTKLLELQQEREEPEDAAGRAWVVSERVDQEIIQRFLCQVRQRHDGETVVAPDDAALAIPEGCADNLPPQSPPLCG